MSAPASSWRFATVTATAPLRVRFDGDTTATDATPVRLVAVAVGQRVWVQICGRQLVVLGVVQ